jgi:hypothetical protein
MHAFAYGRPLCRLAGWALVGFSLCGCETGGERLTPVAGKVTIGGASLTNGSVTFHPDAGKGNTTPHIPVGTLDAEGKYELTSATSPGAPPGWYKVSISAQAPINPNNPYAPPKHLIQPKFSDPSTSGLAVEVVENAAPGRYDFEVTK